MNNPLNIYMDFIKELNSIHMPKLGIDDSSNTIDDVFDKYFEYTYEHGYALKSECTNNIKFYLMQEPYGFAIEPISLALNSVSLLKNYIPPMIKILAYLTRIIPRGRFIPYYTRKDYYHIYIGGLPSDTHYEPVLDSATGKKYYDNNILFSNEMIDKLLDLRDLVLRYTDYGMNLSLAVDTIDINTFKKHFKLQKTKHNDFFLNNRPISFKKISTSHNTNMRYHYDLVCQYFID